MRRCWSLFGKCSACCCAIMRSAPGESATNFTTTQLPHFLPLPLQVNAIREKNGRFLKKIEKTGLWFEIGDDAAREKTSQALRQRAPEMRKLLLDHEMDSARQQQQMMMGMPGVPPMMMPGMNIPMMMPNGNMAFNPAAMMGMPNPAMFNPAMMGMQMNFAQAGMPQQPEGQQGGMSNGGESGNQNSNAEGNEESGEGGVANEGGGNNNNATAPNPAQQMNPAMMMNMAMMNPAAMGMNMAQMGQMPPGMSGAPAPDPAQVQQPAATM